MKKLLYTMILSLVSIYGFGLNFNYYRLYFIDSGYPDLMPILMSGFFVLSEFSLWSFSRKNFVSILLKYGLIIFSIVATLSSQFTSTSQKITESAVNIYEKIDNSADIKRYEEQIKKQDERIDLIFEERKEKSYYGLTDKEMDFAQSEKARYEKLLSDIKSENKIEIQEVFEVKSIYAWFAVDLPRIFKSGLNEEFIRVIFQLFSSFILAAISPVCISLIRTYKPEQKKQVKKHSRKKFTVPKISLPKIKLPKIKKPVINESEPLKRTSASNIVKMLLTGEYGLLSPEIAYKEFLEHPDRDKKKLTYSVGDCRFVYDFIVDNNLENKDKDEIMEVWDDE